MHKYVVLLNCLLFAFCNNPKYSDNTQVVDQDIVDMIHIPETDSGHKDRSKIAQITFEELTFNFDTVAEGTMVSHRFRFRNSGEANLLIHSIRSTCGCTATDWSKELIKSQDTSSILVTFNTEEKVNFQNKPIFVLSNAIPNQIKLELNGYVIPKKINRNIE